MNETSDSAMKGMGTAAPLGGAARIAEKLGTDILNGVYKPNELVPGELELCRRLGASRTVVREAFKLLAAKGLIVSRKRAGTSVRPREAWHMLDEDVLAWRFGSGRAEPKFVFDLLHARAVVEPAAAAMAARRHTPQTFAVIENAFADMAQMAHDAAQFAAPDIRFHRAILTATDNDVMMAFGAGRFFDWVSARYVPDFPFKPLTYFHFPPLLILAALTFAIGFCVIGAFFPANRAARTDPARVLTGQ